MFSIYGYAFESFEEAVADNDEPWAVAYRKVQEAQNEFEKVVLNDMANFIREHHPEAEEMVLSFENGDWDDPLTLVLDEPELDGDEESEWEEKFYEVSQAFVQHGNQENIVVKLS